MQRVRDAGRADFCCGEAALQPAEHLPSQGICSEANPPHAEPGRISAERPGRLIPRTAYDFRQEEGKKINRSSLSRF